MWMIHHVSILVLIFTFTLLFQSTLANQNDNKILKFSDASFSSYDKNITYISSTGYDAKGMAPLYDIAYNILRLFYDDEPIPPGYIVVTENKIELGPKIKENDYGDLLKKYWAVILVAVVCLLIIALMPIIGFFFCCCRCAGKCGGRSQPFDKKHDTCRRVMLGLLLILAATGLIFGVVVAFVTNNYFHQGAENATTTGRQGIDDTQKFLKSTSSHANHLLVTNYNELSLHLEFILKNTSNVVIDRLEDKSNYVQLQRLTDIGKNLPNFKNDLVQSRKIFTVLQINASQLEDHIRAIRRVLSWTFAECEEAACKKALTDNTIANMGVDGIHYDKLPNYSEIVDTITAVENDGTFNEVNVGMGTLQRLKQELENTLSIKVQQVTKAINEAGNGIRGASNEITKVLERISSGAGNNSYKYFNMADNYLDQYYVYSFYGGIAISSCLLLILLCIVLGLCSGIFGKRPDGYGNDCCNKGSGARFLMFGVTFIFLTISILTAIVLVFFVAGLIFRRGVCIPLSDPSHDQVFGYVDQFINLNDILYPKDLSKRANGKARVLPENTAPFRPSDLITSCHKNESIYSVLRLKNFFDIDEVKNFTSKYGIDEELQKLIDSILVPTNIDLITPQAIVALELMSKSNINSFYAASFTDNLKENLTNFDILTLVAKIDEVANSIRNKTVENTLRIQAKALVNVKNELVDPMVNTIRDVNTQAQKWEDYLKFDQSSFEEGINALLKEVREGEQFVETEGTVFLQKVVEELVTVIKDEINTYANLVVRRTENDLGRCGPMSNVYNSTIVSICNRVVDPFNGFWIGVAWCVLIFLPTIIISVKLSTLYQKSDPYPGPLVEAEYLYDAYSERDNIPLANGPKNKRKKKNERRRSSRDRRGDYYEDTSSPHGPSSGPRDARYNDMAPNQNRRSLNTQQSSADYDDAVFTVLSSHPPSPSKYRGSKTIPRHWESGPPRYQNPPMAPPASEYERPPPYYFPGAPSEPE